MTSNAKRDDLATAYELCTGPVGFRNGWDARDAEVAELRAEIKLQQRELEALSNSVNTYDKINDSLKQQVKDLKNKLATLIPIYSRLELVAQLKTKDEAIDVAVKALEKYKDAAFNIDGKIYAVGAPAKETLTKLNTLLGREG